MIEFARELEQRTRSFSVSIYKLVERLPTTSNSSALRSQLFRSAASIGANYREANRAKSRSDFRNKIRICEGEASETYYWLEIIKDLNLLHEKELNPIIKEADELLALFTSISTKLRISQKNKP